MDSDEEWAQQTLQRKDTFRKIKQQFEHLAKNRSENSLQKRAAFKDPQLQNLRESLEFSSSEKKESDNTSESENENEGSYTVTNDSSVEEKLVLQDETSASEGSVSANKLKFEKSEKREFWKQQNLEWNNKEPFSKKENPNGPETYIKVCTPTAFYEPEAHLKKNSELTLNVSEGRQENQVKENVDEIQILSRPLSPPRPQSQNSDRNNDSSTENKVQLDFQNVRKLFQSLSRKSFTNLSQTSVPTTPHLLSPEDDTKKYSPKQSTLEEHQQRSPVDGDTNIKELNEEKETKTLEFLSRPLSPPRPFKDETVQSETVPEKDQEPEVLLDFQNARKLFQSLSRTSQTSQESKEPTTPIYDNLPSPVKTDKNDSEGTTTITTTVHVPPAKFRQSQTFSSMKHSDPKSAAIYQKIIRRELSQIEDGEEELEKNIKKEENVELQNLPPEEAKNTTLIDGVETKKNFEQVSIPDAKILNTNEILQNKNLKFERPPRSTTETPERKRSTSEYKIPSKISIQLDSTNVVKLLRTITKEDSVQKSETKNDPDAPTSNVASYEEIERSLTPSSTLSDASYPQLEAQDITETLNLDHSKQLMVANIGLKLTKGEEVEDFLLSTTENALLVKVSTKTSRSTYAIHLKQSSMEDQDEDLSPFKYFKRYKTLEESVGPLKFVLCANRGISETDSSKFETEKGKLTLKLSRIESDIQNLIFPKLKAKSKFCFKYEVVAGGSVNPVTLEVYRDYFENLILVSNVSTNEIYQEDLETYFEEEFSKNKNSLEQYFNFVRNWCLESNKPKVDKKYLSRLLGLYLISPFVKSYPPEVTSLKGSSKKRELLKNAISEFRVIVIDNSFEKNLIELFKDEFSDLPATLKLYQYAVRPEAKSINDLTDEESMKLMWLSGKCPLLVEDSDDVRKIITICPDLSFIVMGNDVEIPGAFKILPDLMQKNEEVFKSLVESLECNLQGKLLSLGDLIDVIGVEHLWFFTTSKICNMVEAPLEIDTKDDLPPSYVERSLSRPLVSTDFIRNMTDDNLILISRFQEDNLIGSDVSDFEIIDFKHLTDKNKQIEEITDGSKKIFVSEHDCPLDKFNQVCTSLRKRNCHQFRLVDNSLEWVGSKKSSDMNELREYQLDGTYLSEAQIPSFENENSINLICDESGIGKSSLLKSIVKKGEMVWSILISVKDHERHFKENYLSDTYKFRDYILEELRKQLNDFDFIIFSILWEKELVKFLWDGLDELSSECFIVVKELIDKLEMEGYKQWVVCDSRLKDELENYYRVVSRKIKKFDEADQKLYIQNRVNKEVDLEKLDFLQIPLHLSLLTEVVIENPENYKYILQEILTLPDLLKTFVTSRVDKTCEKLQVDLPTKAKLNELFDNYAKVAVTKYFKEILSEEEVKKAEQFLKQTHLNQYPFGIITRITDGEAEFCHLSFQAYFGALYLVNNINKISAQDLHDKNLRYFFDLMAAEGCKAHQAVLSKNFDLLKTCSEEELALKDKAGRTPLHLACYYSTQYPILRTERVENGHIVDDRTVYCQELKPDVPILHYLFEKCDRNEEDSFGQDCLSYDRNNRCWTFILLSRYSDKPGVSDSHVVSILYYSLRFDYYDIFGKIGKMPFIQSKHFDKSLLYLAVYYNAVSCLEKIYSNPDNNLYKEVIYAECEPLFFEEKKNDSIKMLKRLITSDESESKEEVPQNNEETVKNVPTFRSLNLFGD